MLLLFLCSCQQPSVLKVALTPKKSSEVLDPLTIKYSNEFQILENLTIKLVSLDSNSTYQLDLASEILHKKPNKILVSIKDAKYSDGSSITLEDVQMSFSRSLKGTTNVQLSQFIKSISIEGKYLVFDFHTRCKSFLKYLSLPDLGVLHSSQYSKTSILASDYQVTSGPYSLSRDGNSLLRNRYFVSRESDYPDQVQFVSSLRNSSLDQLISREVDLGEFPLEDFIAKQDLLRKSSLRLLGSSSDAITYILFNPNSKSKLKEEHVHWLRKVINEKFEIPKPLSIISRKTWQYFPEESKAYLPMSEYEKIFKYSNLVKPNDFPSQIVIQTYTTAFKVTPKPLIDILENIEGLNIKVINNVKPEEFYAKYKSGDISVFLNIMSTDYRVPEEAINFEFISPERLMNDPSGRINKRYLEYQETDDQEEETILLKEISELMLKSNIFIPLFHATTPYFYNSETVELNGANNLFITNFWKIKMI